MTASEVHKQSKSAQEHAVLGRRSHSIHLAIASVTPCAFLVCAVISVLFLGVFFALDVSNGIGLIFPTATLDLIGGLVAFLREIQLATSSLSGPKGG